VIYTSYLLHVALYILVSCFWTCGSEDYLINVYSYSFSIHVRYLREPTKIPTTHLIAHYLSSSSSSSPYLVARLCRRSRPLMLDTDMATMSSNLSGGRSYSDPRTTIAYAARHYFFSNISEVGGEILPSSIFSRDCAVTCCFLESSLTYGVNRSKSVQIYFRGGGWSGYS
jgi:hypothetical protein